MLTLQSRKVGCQAVVSLSCKQSETFSTENIVHHFSQSFSLSLLKINVNMLMPRTILVDWNFPEIQRAYLEPLLSQLRSVASVDVESQMLGFIAFNNVQRSKKG